MTTSGRQLLDTCGEPWFARGVEQLTGQAFSADGTLLTLAIQLVESGANAVRLLPVIDELTPDDLERLLQAFASRQVVVYLSPGDRSWFARPAIREVLLRNERGLILDAFQEPNYDDAARWRVEAKQAVAALRAQGYRCPLTVLADAYGRNLPTLLAHGHEIVAADPLHNLVLGWQAYWGQSGFYQRAYGMSLEEGVERAASLPFPVQLGIDRFADPGDPMEYGSVMTLAQKHQLGWLWWDYWNRWDSLGNNLSRNGTMQQLTAAGQDVLVEHPAALTRTSRKACFH